MGVRRRISRLVVRAEIRFDFNNPAGDQPGVRFAHEQLAEEARGDTLYRRYKERVFEPSPPAFSYIRSGIGPRTVLDSFQSILRKTKSPHSLPRRLADRSPALLLQLVRLFHSSISASTSSAWPCGVTLGKMCSTGLIGSDDEHRPLDPHHFLAVHVLFFQHVKLFADFLVYISKECVREVVLGLEFGLVAGVSRLIPRTTAPAA